MFGDPSKNKKGWDIYEIDEYLECLTDYHSNGSYESLRDNVTLLDSPNYALMVRTTDLENNNFVETARRLKEKILTYSVPRTDEETGETYVDVRFFPNEASGIIYQLLVTNRPKDDIEDYYSILLENRSKKSNS